MNEDQQMAVAVEAVFYESTVSTLVHAVREQRAAGDSRELILHELTGMLLSDLPERGQIASLAAMAVVMRSEDDG